MQWCCGQQARWDNRFIGGSHNQTCRFTAPPLSFAGGAEVTVGVCSSIGHISGRKPTAPPNLLFHASRRQFCWRRMRLLSSSSPFFAMRWGPVNFRIPPPTCCTFESICITASALISTRKFHSSWSVGAGAAM